MDLTVEIQGRPEMWEHLVRYTTTRENLIVTSPQSANQLHPY